MKLDKFLVLSALECPQSFWIKLGLNNKMFDEVSNRVSGNINILPTIVGSYLKHCSSIKSIRVVGSILTLIYKYYEFVYPSAFT